MAMLQYSCKPTWADNRVTNYYYWAFMIAELGGDGFQIICRKRNLCEK